MLVRRVREQGWSVTRSAEAAGISRRTAHKWLGRFQPEQPASLADRSSRPRRQPGATPGVWCDMVVLLRRTKMTGPQIARSLKLPRATVARVLRRAGLERLKKLEPKGPEQRYEHALGVRIRRILSDNGSGYIARCFAHEAERLKLVHKRTRAYRPQTNGKAERFIQTLMREWAYAVAYLTSAARAHVLPRWLRHYNERRPHGSLDGLPPFSRLRPRV